MTRPALTHQQSQVYAYMVKFLHMNDAMPTMANIARAFGWASPNAAHTHVAYLISKGYLDRNEQGAPMLVDRRTTQVGVCGWSMADSESGTWLSSCGELWSFIDGGPSENRVSFCHHCGGRVHTTNHPEATP